MTIWFCGTDLSTFEQILQEMRRLRSDPKYFEHGTPMGSEVRLLNRLLNHLMGSEVRLCASPPLLFKLGDFCTGAITNPDRFRTRKILDQSTGVGFDLPRPP